MSGALKLCHKWRKCTAKSVVIRRMRDNIGVAGRDDRLGLLEIGSSRKSFAGANYFCRPLPSGRKVSRVSRITAQIEMPLILRMFLRRPGLIKHYRNRRLGKLGELCARRPWKKEISSWQMRRLRPTATTNPAESSVLSSWRFAPWVFGSLNAARRSLLFAGMRTSVAHETRII